MDPFTLYAVQRGHIKKGPVKLAGFMFFNEDGSCTFVPNRNENQVIEGFSHPLDKMLEDYEIQYRHKRNHCIERMFMAEYCQTLRRAMNKPHNLTNYINYVVDFNTGYWNIQEVQALVRLYNPMLTIERMKNAVRPLFKIGGGILNVLAAAQTRYRRQRTIL